MKRTHWFEFEDLEWVPRAIRDGGTDLLDLGFSLTKFYRPLVSQLTRVLDACSATAVVDLCSGSGGGALAMFHALAADGRTNVRWQFSDRFPNAGAIERLNGFRDSRLSYTREPVDARAAPHDAEAVRTMFGALHHFPPDQVRAIFAALMEAGAPFAFFDVAASPALRRLPGLLAPIALIFNMAVLLLTSFLLVPFARPFRLSRWIFTYVVPAIPLLVAWDGTVSALRAYAPEELLDIARSIPASERYDVRAERAGRALALTAVPRRGVGGRS